MAEIDFRNTLKQIGFQDRVSIGGWIARSQGSGNFGSNTVVMFPETIRFGVDYSSQRDLPEPSHGLHTICATFHQIGIRSFFCVPIINHNEEPETISWKSVELGLPTQQRYENFLGNIIGFNERTRRYNFLRHRTQGVTDIPEEALAEEFSKENLRVHFQTSLQTEMSDIDGIFWGEQYTYPLEIKEKTSAHDRNLGEFFGLDVGPFVKLAFYSAKRGNLHSIFIVREIDNQTDRNLVNWWYIPFDRLASFASWVPMGGGRSMQGGNSTVVKIPKNQFSELNAKTLQTL